MAKLTQKQIQDESGSYYEYSVYDRDGNLVLKTDDESSARSEYNRLQRQEDEEDAKRDAENSGGNTTEQDTPVNNNPVDNSTTDTDNSTTGGVDSAAADGSGIAPGDAVTGTAPINNSSI